MPHHELPVGLLAIIVSVFFCLVSLICLIKPKIPFLSFVTNPQFTKIICIAGVGYIIFAQIHTFLPPPFNFNPDNDVHPELTAENEYQRIIYLFLSFLLMCCCCKKHC